MYERRYILEPYKGLKTRHSCPNCKHHKVFTLYFDTKKGEHLNDIVGKCNRESKCGYHYTPKQYFADNNIGFDKIQVRRPTTIQPSPPKPVSFIPVETFKASLKSHESNNFIKYLIKLFEVEETEKLIEKYFIGSSKHWNGATIFWQIDKDYKVRTGKIMLYNPDTGKRIKKPFKYINWAHSVLKLPDFELKQCLFGEHLLSDKSKPVAIVESEKTAIIASVYLPAFVWLAAGSLDNLTLEKCKVLSGFKVFLFPDLNGFEKWKNKATELSSIANFIVSDLLENNSTEDDKKEGYDLADYLIQFDYKQFLESNKVKSDTQSNVKGTIQSPVYQEVKPEIKTSLDWSNEVNELESYFQSIVLPDYPIKLNQAETIKNVSNFIDSHLIILKNNNGRKVFLPYLDRLRKVKNYLLSEL